MTNGRFERRSIPPWTALDVLRAQAREERSIGSVENPLRNSMRIGGLKPERSWQNGLAQNHGGFNVADHVYERPKTLIVPWAERITWATEWHEDYNAHGSLLVILQFFGIEFTKAPVFKKKRANYGTDGVTFYSPIHHKGKKARLTLATLDDIIEFQVVEDDNPISRDETRLPQLTTTHDPTSMTVYERNGLVVAGYNRL